VDTAHQMEVLHGKAEEGRGTRGVDDDQLATDPGQANRPGPIGEEKPPVINR